MSPSLVGSDVPTTFRDPVWNPAIYRCQIRLTREEDGSFSAIVLNLPGCGSCGDTEEEALQNVREAVRGVIESHVAAREDIPWVNSPRDAHQLWIVVNAE